MAGLSESLAARGLAWPGRPPIGRLAGGAIYLLANLAGLLAFVSLLARPAGGAAGGTAAGLAAPLLLGLLAGLCFLALAVELGAAGLGARALAVLGVLVAMNSGLRFIEVALPGPGGFTPIFVLIVLAGYAYGARFGFLTGALTLAVSALITGGVGPWLPYQMYAAGWVGLSAGWLPGAGDPGAGAAGVRPSRRLVLGLAAFGAAWGFLYGLIMTLWDWSYLDPGGLAGAAAGSPPLARFLAYYALSALVWDAFGALGTLLLLLAAGGPLLAALRRAGLRFRFEAPAPGPAQPAGLAAMAPAAVLAPAAWPGPAPDRVEISAEAGSSPHARAWLAWALGVAVLVSVTRNPFVITAAALTVALVRAALPPRGGPELPVGRVALVMVPLAALYNGLMAHAGATVLARLPASWPLVGGPLTLEALAYGALTGLALATLLATFATLRRALSARELVRLVPRALGPLTLVLAVALAYAPATLAQVQRVREAQALRGHRLRGPRGWAPLALPLVVGGLEGALSLAESLTARGLEPAGGPPPTRVRLGLAGGLALVVGGWLAPLLGLVPAAAGWLAVLGGAAWLLLQLARLGRRWPHTDFRASPWRPADTAMALAAWLPLAALTLAGGRAALAWLPYPALAPPPLTPALALALAGLALPALRLARGRRGAATAARPGR